MGRFRVYLKTYAATGALESTYTDISDDVMSLSDISQSLESSDFSTGVLRNSSVTITLRNDHGRYLREGNLKSFFAYKTKNSRVKITWDYRLQPIYAGFAYPDGDPIGGEVDVFEGLLSTVTSKSDISKQQVQFTVLGLESILDQVEVPYGSLSNGQSTKTFIHTCLNQSKVTEIFTVSLDDINPAVNENIDDKSSLENRTVGEALRELLKIGNAVLYVRGGKVIVSSKTASAESVFTFYGQASKKGIENLVNIPRYSDGFDRMYNLIRWSGSAAVARDSSSIALHEVKDYRSGISSQLIAEGSTAKQVAILDSYIAEYGNPLAEIEGETPLFYDQLELFFLDRVSIDYPTIYVSADAGPVPRFGIAKFGEARFPIGQYSLTIQENEPFKIISRRIMVGRQMISFGMRRVP